MSQSIMGRKPKDIDWKLVDALLARAATVKDAAASVGVHADTLEKAIKRKFNQLSSDYRQEKMCATRLKLVEKAIEKALGGDNTMLIFCLKNLCGWSDRNESVAQVSNDTKLVIQMNQATVNNG